MSKENKWNEQHITIGRVVAYRRKLSDKTKIGVVTKLDYQSVTVEFPDATRVVLKEDLTPIWSNFHP